MINIGMYYSIKKGHEKEFENYFNQVLAVLNNAKIGFLSGKLYREVSNEREYMIYSEWESMDSFRKFMASHDFQQATEFGKTIMESQPRHKVFNND